MRIGIVIVTRKWKLEDIAHRKTKLDVDGYPTEVIMTQNNLNRARNLGASRLDTNLIAFVDDDNTISSCALEEMAKVFVDDSVAVVSPVIYDREMNVWFAGSCFSKYGSTRIDRSVPEGLRETESFHDCFMVRKIAFDLVGGFDEERFPFYLGEADLAARIHGTTWLHLSGISPDSRYRFVVTPSASVVHDIGPVTGLRSLVRASHLHNPMRTYYVGRNLSLFLKRHMPKTYHRYLVSYFPIRTALHLSAMLASGKFAMIPRYLRGVYDGIK